jgi:SpoVK/Ycf46/Vps4 family AAA+-type ATPase
VLLVQAKLQLEQLLIWPHDHVAELKRVGVKRPPVGLLLHGPPGTGKTLLAKAVAAEIHASFVALDLASTVSAYLGESERVLAAMFSAARRAAPAVLFLDELDALFVDRGSAGGGTQGRLTTTLATELDRCSDELAAQLLLADDSRDRLRGVHVIAATNAYQRIDPCLRAVGRLEREIFVGYPDWKARRYIVASVLRGGLAEFVADDVTAEVIVELTSEQGGCPTPCSGADIKAILRQALATAIAASVKLPETTTGCDASGQVRVTLQHIRDAVYRAKSRPQSLERDAQPA